MIVGCKKTLVEYRGWVNRNRYYIRIPIRMGGLFSRNDFVQRLTRPEYFPIATSPQKPHPKAIPHNTHPLHTNPIIHFPTPIPLKNSISQSSTLQKLPQSPQSHPHSPSNPTFYLHFFQKSPKTPKNSTKSNQKSPKSPKISQKSTKFTPKNHPISQTSHIYTSKQLQKHLSKNLTNLPTQSTHPRFYHYSTYQQTYPQHT